MTCRHGPNDSSCSSHRDYTPPPTYSSSAYSSKDTPDASNYKVIGFKRVSDHIVLKVKYPNCKNCAYEGQKIMVFLNVTEEDAMMWRKIDPHFRGAKSKEGEAPSPAARFPGTAEGWSDALDYAARKGASRTRG